jgi:hypothetical protein
VTSPSTTEQTRPRTYFGWQQERVAFMYGLSGQRCLMLGGAALLAVWPLLVSHLRTGLVTWPIAALLAVLAFLRLGGRTVDEWATAVASYGLLRVQGQHKFASAAFAPPAKTAAPDAPKPQDLPGVLAPVQILQAQMPGGGDLAIAHHRHDRTYTAVARVRFPGIGLVDTTRREQRVAGWGAMLAGLCTEGAAIVRVQALQRLLPESGAALRRWHTDHLAADAPGVSAQVTAGLLGTATLATCDREAFVAFTLDARRAGRAIRHAGGGTVGAAAVLTRQLRALSGSVAGADLQIEAWLGPRDLAEVIRTAFDPHAGRHLAERRAAATGIAGGDGLAAGVDPAVSGPAAAVAEPGAYVHDGARSVSFWVHDWPRNEVYATALAPLLGEGQHRRAFSLHVEPLGPRQAAREVMRERTARSVAVRMRQRSGQIVPEHERQALDRARAQDMERAAGHGLVRFAAYVTVTVTDPDDDLEDACAALEADAAAANRVAADVLPRTSASRWARCRWGSACHGSGGEPDGPSTRRAQLRSPTSPTSSPPPYQHCDRASGETTTPSGPRSGPATRGAGTTAARLGTAVRRPGAADPGGTDVPRLHRPGPRAVSMAVRGEHAPGRRVHRCGLPVRGRVLLPSDRVAAPRLHHQPEPAHHRSPRCGQVRHHQGHRQPAAGLRGEGVCPRRFEERVRQPRPRPRCAAG